MSRLIALAVLAAICSCSFAAKVLVLYDDPLIRSTHSRYFRELHNQGHTITIKSVTDSSLKLKDWDDWIYEKLIMFAPGATGSKLPFCHACAPDLRDHRECRCPQCHLRNCKSYPHK